MKDINQRPEIKEMKIAFIGCGRAGSKLCSWLSKSGYRIEALFDRERQRAEALSEFIKSGKVFDSASAAAAGSDIIFISTPDGVIEDTCNEIASSDGFKAKCMVFHLSGSLPSSILKKAAEKGAFTASFHPLQSLAGEDTENNPFQGVLVAMEGHPEAIAAAKKISADIGATPYEIDGGAKTMYHASAVIASNYLVSLMKMASKVMAASGIPEEKAFEFLLPLIKGTISNMEKMGVDKALTGPVARGDVITVSSHLVGIEEKTPELKKAYIELGKIALEIARNQGFLDKISLDKLGSLFSD